MAHLAARYTQDIGMAANDGDRCQGYRARNLLARPGRSRERITGSSDKSQGILACRRCPAFAPGGLKRTRAAFAQFRKSCGVRRKSVATTSLRHGTFARRFMFGRRRSSDPAILRQRKLSAAWPDVSVG